VNWCIESGRGHSAAGVDLRLAASHGVPCTLLIRVAPSTCVSVSVRYRLIGWVWCCRLRLHGNLLMLLNYLEMALLLSLAIAV
jgi:hypothetical protein